MLCHVLGNSLTLGEYGPYLVLCGRMTTLKYQFHNKGWGELALFAIKND